MLLVRARAAGTAAVVAAAMSAVVGGGVATAATSATGADVSYPQCSRTLPSGEAFVVVGVNDGLANNVNPCLGREWTYALASTGGTRQAKAQSYLNTGDPGNTVADWPSPANPGNYPDATLATPYGSCGYAAGSSGPGANSPGCAYVYGYDMVVGGIADGANGTVAGDLASFRGATGASLVASPVWLDVETGNSWQSGAAGRSANVADLNGMVAALEAAGAVPGAVGVYSTASQWDAITGTPTGTAAGKLAGLNDWLPGASSQRGAVADCRLTAFTAGKVVLAQWVTRSIDGDYSCIG